MHALTGTIVNTAAIIAGSIIGLILKKGIPENIKDTVMSGLALCVLLIGVTGSIKVNNVLLVIISVVIGAIIGELIDLDNLLKKLGDKIEGRFKNGNGGIAEGFVTSSLLFCVGAMAIVGSLQSGLTGDNKTLFAKSVLDGISSIVFASSLGIGVILSAATVFVYQGAIALCAVLLKALLVQSVINDMTAVGSLLIIGLSLNMLKVTKIKVANLLPAVLVPMIYQVILNIIK